MFEELSQSLAEIESVLNREPDEACLNVHSVSSSQDKDLGDIFKKLIDRILSTESNMVVFKKSNDSEKALEKISNVRDHNKQILAKYASMKFQLVGSFFKLSKY